MHSPLTCHQTAYRHSVPDTAGARPSFYSHWNAPGMVMAAGNSGEYLDLASDAVCTWMSTDGGLTWTDVADHAAIYEFGDHGGIILLAPHEVSTVMLVG